MRIAALAALTVLLTAGAAPAQDRPGGFLDNLFNRGQPQAQQQPQQQQPPQQQQLPPPQAVQQQAPGQLGADTGGGVEARIDRIEAALRQLTGTVEQLQHQNQMLQMQLKRMQDDTEYRFQQLGSRGGAPAPARRPAWRRRRAMCRRRRRGRPASAAMPSIRRCIPMRRARRARSPAKCRAPYSRASRWPIRRRSARRAGARRARRSISIRSPAMQPPAAVAAPPMAPTAPNGQLPPPPPRNTSATGAQLATLPPSSSPKDEYDLAYGYVLTKNYALATQAFRDFLRRHPKEKLVPDGGILAGRKLYQQQRYRDAAKSFLTVSTKYEHSGKAPEALLRLGQSLAALHRKEAACATFAEVGRKYPRAPASVKRSVAQEQKRVHC